MSLISAIQTFTVRLSAFTDGSTFVGQNPPFIVSASWTPAVIIAQAFRYGLTSGQHI
jgi:hypothetical protein